MEHTKQTVPATTEIRGIFRFFKEFISAFLMAFVFITYVIQSFKVPSESMADTILVGDLLLGLKFIYGAPIIPFSYTRFPGITDPNPGDIVIFEYPGNDNKEYIKRCIAGPGQTIEINGTRFIVDGKELSLPPHGKFINNGIQSEQITNFAKLYIPKKNDTLKTRGLPIREALFTKHLINQEYPTSRLRKFVSGFFLTRPFFPPKKIYNTRASLELELFINGTAANTGKVSMYTPSGFIQEYSFNDRRFKEYVNSIDNWFILDNLIDNLTATLAPSIGDTQRLEIRPRILLHGKPIDTYIVKHNNYFMAGDNRDNSLDSRYWGFVNRNFIDAKAFIFYFSLKEEVPLLLLPLKIRWNRIGKLIRNYNELSPAGK